MKRDPWVQPRRMTSDELEAEIQAFLKKGGEIIRIGAHHNSTKTNSDTAVKIGKVHRQLEACKKKKD
jgi:hypothetical protein